MKYEDLKRIERGTRRHFHDDITVIVIDIGDPPGSSKGGFKDYCLVRFTSAPVDIFSLKAGEAEDALRDVNPKQNSS